MPKKRLEEILDLIKDMPAYTVNTRLSRYLRVSFDLRMAGSGLKSWQTPSIMPLSAWLEELWDETLPEKPLLGGLRAKALWERIVSEAPSFKTDALLFPDGVVQSSFEAYELISEYRLERTLAQEDFYLTPEAKALKGWMRSYRNAVDKLGFIERPVLPELLAGAIKEGGIKPPERIILAGFDELTPRVALFIGSLTEKGVKVIFWPEPPGSAAQGAGDKVPDKDGLNIRPYADEREEVLQAARWARNTMRPGMRIGFIVPELARYRGLIKKEFSAELDPVSVLADGNKKDVFNISLGEPLCEEPLVKSALDILSMTEGDIETDKISSMLLSPFFSPDGYLDRARLDVSLRTARARYLSLYDVRKKAGAITGLDDFEKRLGLWIEDLRDPGMKRRAGYWAGRFSGLLKKLGWLVSVKLSGAEFQALEAWNGLLEGFTGLDDIMGNITRPEAVSKLRSMAKEAVHQSETHECSIQVLGLLESAGQQFDHIWLMGCHEYAVPAEPSPNPFIPVYMQKRHGLPHSSYERELAFAKSALKRIFQSAPRIEVSYPKMLDGRPVRPSPLFTGPSVSGILVETSRIKDSVHAAYCLEEDVDKFIPVAENCKVTGGTMIIKNQADCPFRAFAMHRLNIREMDSPEAGITPAERGSFIHLALGYFWDKAKGGRGLVELKKSGGLKAHIEEAVSRALDTDMGKKLSRRFIEIERERLTALVGEWVGFEETRPGFTVRQTEEDRVIEIKGLRLKGRPDRIDELDSGGMALIDYKSKDTTLADWSTPRPREPQLLIYSLSGEYGAVAFARLKPGECGFTGVSEGENMLPGVESYRNARLKDDFDTADGWNGVMGLWRSKIEALAVDFLAGAAHVDPNGGPFGEKSPCRHCGLAVLCRVSESAAYGAEGDEDGG